MFFLFRKFALSQIVRRFVIILQFLFNLVRGFIDRSARNDLIYRWFWNPIIRFTNLAERARLRHDLDPYFGRSVAAHDCLKELRVLTGPFKGMKYPNAIASGSVLAPKLLGTYEAELHQAIDLLIDYQPSVVFDIGCAEGYYAVGFAMRLSGAKVHAFDINSTCRALCSEMAIANNVSERIVIGGLCDRQMLKSLSGVRSVVFSDCEGYEQKLFDAQIAGLLSKTAFLIETHDFRIPSISRDLRIAFSKTHEIQQFCSVSDLCRPQVFNYPDQYRSKLADQIAIMAENRPAEVWWLLCMPKSGSD